MKKIILTLSLAVILILSGCFAFEMSQGYYNPVPNSELSKNLIAKMQNNIDTHTFEGFTSESTFGDVLAKTEAKKLSYACLNYSTELLGYAAAMQCSFSNYEGKLLLDDLYFDIIFYEAETDNISEETLLAKMVTELGSHKYTDEDGHKDYKWQKDGWEVAMSFQEDDSGSFADISVSPSMVIRSSFPKIPDIFPYQLGTDIYTVYQNEKPQALPEGDYNSGSIDYEDGGIEVSLWFETDETGAIKLCNGSYDIRLNDMGIKDSLDYFESLADGLEDAAGKPEARGYGISEVVEDSEGETITVGRDGGGQGLTAQYILDSKAQYYWFEMNWPGIDFWADYGSDVPMVLHFSEEYFSGAAGE